MHGSMAVVLLGNFNKIHAFAVLYVYKLYIVKVRNFSLYAQREIRNYALV